MKFSCPKEVILGAVQTTAKAAAGKSSIPALEGILLELEGNTMTVTGYNLDIGIKTDISVNGFENGNIVINAKMAGDIFRKMPSGEITFVCDDNNMATISNGATEFSVVCMSADDYPIVPQVNPDRSFSMPQKLLKSMIIQTKFAVATVDTKPSLMGCNFEITDNILYVVGIDGVRIALRQEPVAYENISFIVPARTLEEVTHILSDDDDKNVTLCIDKNQISFGIDDYILISRLLDGEFYAYKNHFENIPSTVVELNVREISDMIDRAMLIMNDKNKSPIRCEINGDSLSMSCTTALGKISDKMNVKYNGEPITIGFNAKYLMDVFKVCDTDCVKMAIKSATSPIIILPMEGNTFTYLVLPMRLK